MKIKKILKIIALILLLLVIAFVSFILNETKDEVNADLNNIEEKLKSFYNEQKLAGFAVSVFNADSVFFSKGIGYADLENKNLYTVHTQQYVASVSKTTIGIALMKAKELGLINLDDLINKYLPFKVQNPKYPDAEITIRHLATHTSSIDYNEKVIESLYSEQKEKERLLVTFFEDYFLNKRYGEVQHKQRKIKNNCNTSVIIVSNCKIVKI